MSDSRVSRFNKIDGRVLAYLGIAATKKNLETQFLLKAVMVWLIGTHRIGELSFA